MTQLPRLSAPRALMLSAVFAASLAYGQSAPSPCTSVANPPKQAFPIVSLGCGLNIKYIGVYTPTAEYKPVTRRTRATEHSAVGAEATRPSAQGYRPREVPDFVYLHPMERDVMNLVPPAHARRPVKGQSLFASLRDDIITFAYGRERVLFSPEYLVTDSKGRIIVSDPGASSVHVLDGRDSFRIVGGEGHRLHTPAGVAVDADDNIYVADTERGLVGVFDSNGRYLFDMGSLTQTEGLFESPTAIAIDKSKGNLYVIDAKRNHLYELDLKGNVLQHVGSAKTNASGLMLRARAKQERPKPAATSFEFEKPLQMAISGDELLIFDAEGSRVIVSDLDCKFRSEFSLQTRVAHPLRQGVGFATGPGGNIFLSNLTGPEVAMYNREGRKVASFGNRGEFVGQFVSPAAVWMDSKQNVYVSDSHNRNIQVFQATAAQ